MGKSKEREKSRLSEKHLEAHLAAVRGAEGNQSERLKELFLSGLLDGKSTCLLIFAFGFSSYAEKNKYVIGPRTVSFVKGYKMGKM